MSRVNSKGGSSPVMIKSEPCNDDVQRHIPNEAETGVDYEYIKEDIKESSLMELKQEEIIIKDEIPSRSDIQTDLIDDNYVPTKDIELSPTSPNTETSISTEENQFACSFFQNKTTKRSLKPSRNSKLQCEYKTPIKGNLVQHMVIHTGERRFACNLCDFKTAEKGNLKRHMMTHTGEKPFACNICEFKTIQKGHLKSHLLTHTVEKPFICNLCEFKTTQNSHLKSHLLTHTGEKPFANNLYDEKDESLMKVKQEEIIIKDEIPISSATENN